MPGRKKVFDSEGAQRYYCAAETEEKLVLNLRNIHCTMRALYEGKGSWKRVLIVLQSTGTIPQKELTARLRIQPGSASDVLAKMEGMGLITRAPNRLDQRTSDVSLTQRGEMEARTAIAQRRQRHREMFACLDQREKAELLRIMEKINADWDERYRRSAED